MFRTETTRVRVVEANHTVHRIRVCRSHMNLIQAQRLADRPDLPSAYSGADSRAVLPLFLRMIIGV